MVLSLFTVFKGMIKNKVLDNTAKANITALFFFKYPKIDYLTMAGAFKEKTLNLNYVLFKAIRVPLLCLKFFDTKLIKKKFAGRTLRLDFYIT